MIEPLKPRITKTTAIAAIQARFKSTAELLERFELAKNQANLWDGERDGLREVVKSIPDGQYDNVILSSSMSAEVLYPNSGGKHQIENCMQSTVPIADPGIGIQVYGCGLKTPEEFLDAILSQMQHGKDKALAYLQSVWVGEGITVDNDELYEKKGSSKAKITILP